MDDVSIMQILILIVLIMMSAYFSATETAFTSLNKIRVKNLASEGDKKAAKVLNLVENYDKLLTTILIGNNIVNITATAIATVLFTGLFKNNGAVISTVVMTLTVLIFGEISPKSLAKEAPESFAMATVNFLQLFIWIFSPLNFIFGLFKKLFVKIFRIEGEKGITEDEILTIVEEARQDGGIDEEEGELLKSVIEFNDLEARDILTPRVDISAIEDDASSEDIALLFTNTGYSRLPVYKDSIDNIVGIIHQKDFYSTVYGTKKTIKAIMKEPVFIAPSMKISNLLKQLQQNKSHIAVVADEFGGTMGIVTMEDILEELVGEIWDEHDEIIEEIQKISDDEYKVLGSINLDVMLEQFEVEGESDSTTVSGWVVEQFENIPDEGDSFIYENLEVTVTKCDSRRVEEVHIKVLPDKTEEEEKEPEEK